MRTQRIFYPQIFTRWLFAAITGLITTLASAGDIEFHPLPEWVVDRPLELEQLKPAAKLQAGFEFITNEHQINHSLESLAYFSRNAVAVHTMVAVNELSNIAFAYIPQHQNYKVHYVRLHRNGEVLDMMDSIQTRFMRQDAATQSQHDQLATSVALLVGGVRMGDVIDYALTIEGVDPTYRGLYEGVYNQIGSDVSNIYRRVIVPKKEKLEIKLHANHAKPQTIKHAKTIEYIWDIDNIKMIEQEQRVPIWFSPLPRIEYSNMRSWKSIARWGADKFELPLDNPDIADLVHRITKDIETQEEQIRTVLNYVQANIRYVGPGIGRNGHRPFTPETTLQRGYGDCKDKAVLMQAMLQQIDIDAWPALVNSGGAHMLDIRLPSVSAFDHAIIYAKTGAKEYWLDPTALPQQNRPASLEPVWYFSKALVLNNKSRKLLTIPAPKTDDEHFDRLHEITFELTDDPESSANIHSREVFTNTTADSVRSALANYGTFQLNKETFEHLKDHFEGLEQTKTVSSHDIEGKNQVVIESEYLLPKAWSLDDKSGKYQFKHHPCKLRKANTTPAKQERKYPYALAYPHTMIERLRFKVPKRFDMLPRKKQLDTTHFRFQSDSFWQGDHYIVEYRIQNKVDHVPPEEYEQYRADIKKMRGASNHYKLWINKTNNKKPTEIDLNSIERP